MANFTRYANLTEAQKQAIIERYRHTREMGASDPGHAVACAAGDVLVKTARGWNGKIGADAFAAALAVLVMEKEVELVDANWPGN